MFDYAIKNGTIADGTGSAPFAANVYVQDGRIAAIGQEDFPAKEVLDASGHWVSPGFIDIHTHSDNKPLYSPSFAGTLAQGVTFHLAGNCGYSAIPKRDGRFCHMQSYVSQTVENGFAINFATLVGHGTLRNYCMADPDAKIPTAEELDAMCRQLEQELENGALGMSLGLIYLPGRHAETEELIALAKVVKRYDGIVSVHMRDESDDIFDALREMGRVARESGVRVEISHFKIMHFRNWGKAQQIIDLWQALRAEGLDIRCDQYPYCATSTSLKGLVPPWAKKGTSRELAVLMKDDAYFDKMRDHINEFFEKSCQPDRVVVSNSLDVYPQLDGKNMRDVAEYFGLPVVDAYRKVIIDTEGGAKGIFHTISEEDMLKILSREDVALGSDGYGFGLGEEALPGKPHPRSAGTFPRALRLCREHKLMPMEKMVRKMTGLSAQVLHLQDRGLLKEGYAADITVFNPQIIADKATFEEPTLLAEGVKYVLVNGRLAFCEGAATQERAGQFIVRSEMK